MRKLPVLATIGLLLIGLSSAAEAASKTSKKKCSSNQEIALLDLDRRILSLNKIVREQSLALEVNKELLAAATATNNLSDSSRIGVLMTNLRQRLEGTQKTINQISNQKYKILGSCNSNAGKSSASSSSGNKAFSRCTPSQVELIQLLAQQHENTQLQVQEQELEIIRQRKIARESISYGRNSEVAKANFEIQRRVTQAGELSAYASVIKKQFEIANSSCANSNISLSDLLSKTFVPNSLIAMNINRFESVNKEITRPIMNSNTGNLTIACDNSSSDSSSYSNVGVYFAFTTKKPDIWDRYNGAGVDSDAFTKGDFQPNYLKEPDSTFTLRDFSGNPLTFKGFKAQVKSGITRDICEYEILPITPSEYVSNAVGIWYFVIASNKTSSSSSTTIWSLSGFTLQNYLNPLKY